MKIRPVIAALGATLLLASCSVSSGGSGEDESGDNVIPQSGKVEDISEIVHESMEGKKIGFVPVGLGIPLTEQWSTEIKRGFDQLGAEVVQRDAGWDAAKMPDIIDSLINSDVDVLVLHNPDVGVLTSQIQRAKQEGIYVVTLNMMPSQQSDAFLGGDFKAMAEELGNRVIKDCQAKGKTKVAAVDGFGTDGASVAAREGWNSVFEDSDIEVVSEQSANFLPGPASKVARTVLQQHDDLCAFIGNFDTMMLGVSEVVGQTGKSGNVGVYTIDASAPSCQNIKNGSLTVAVSYAVPAMGSAVVSTTQSLIESGSDPGSTRSVQFMPYELVDKSNVGDIAQACYGTK